MVKEDFVIEGQIMTVTESGEEVWSEYRPLLDADGDEIGPWNPLKPDPSNDEIIFSQGNVRDLPPSGVISMDDIRQEVKGSGQVSLNDADFRDLIGKSSGQQQAMSEYYGKSASQAGDGEIGTGGNCFPYPNEVTANELGKRVWGVNKALNKDGYCGWENQIQSNTNWYHSWAKWTLPWLCMCNRVDRVRLSYRAMCSAYGNGTSDHKIQLYLANAPFYFKTIPGGGANTGGTSGYEGAFIWGKVATAYQQQAQGKMNSSGGVDALFPNSDAVEPEESFVNLAGNKNSTTYSDPQPLQYIHTAYWGNYAGTKLKSLYFRMENA